MAGWNNTGSSAKCVDMRPERYKHITEGCCPYRRIALSLRFFQPFQPFQSFQPPQFCYIVTCYNKVVPHVTFVRRPPPTTSPTRPCPKINIRREGLVRRPKGEAKAEQRPMEVNATPVWATYPHSPAAPPAAPHYRATKQRSRTP